MFSGPLALMSCHLLSDLSNPIPIFSAPLSDLSLKSMHDGNAVDTLPSINTIFSNNIKLHSSI